MDKTPLYVQIADAVRQELLEGELRPGDLLPPVREMAGRWACTPGTVQQAYKRLAQQGVVVSRSGQGTRIGAVLAANPPACLLRPVPGTSRVRDAVSRHNDSALPRAPARGASPPRPAEVCQGRADRCGS